MSPTKPEEVQDLDSLLSALDGRGQDPKDRERFDQAIWTARGTQAAILVSDLSGFTRLTKAHGILHFLSVFRRCQLACRPIIDQLGGHLLKQEADDLIAIFEDPGTAIRCGVEMLTRMRTINRSLPEDSRVLMCLGIDYGHLLQLSDDAFGDPVNVAYKLGEDLAKPEEILIGSAAYDEAVRRGFDLSAWWVSPVRSLATGDVALPHHLLRLKPEE